MQAPRFITVSTPEVRFYAQRCGEGAPRAVLLHGFGGDMRTMDPLWLPLCAALPALRYDQRGYGGSVALREGRFSHADDLVALLDALDVERVHLVGVSQGAAIALNCALDYPDRVERLVLISPGMVAWEWSAEWRRMWRELVDLARAGDLLAARERWWRHPLFASTRESPAAQALRDSIQRYSGAQWVEDLQRPALPDVERLYSLAAPTLLLSGGRDLPDFRLIADVIEAGAPAVQRVDFPACGHLLHLEDPEGCAREILRFLAAP